MSEGRDWEEETIDEGPQDIDLEAYGEDVDETVTAPCPVCGREIPEFADRCPYCENWVVQGATSTGSSSGRSWVFIVAALLALLGFILVYVL